MQIVSRTKSGFVKVGGPGFNSSEAHSTINFEEIILWYRYTTMYFCTCTECACQPAGRVTITDKQHRL